ncbi:DUF2202 domain-containing protein [Microbacter margulisiae]|uniref:DUF2202 domain-containing protein n=1 Tax=Microbacter margulisiae TaxID=1350067 RepID=A0A7W5DPA3_9PORP|nr:DUF2202 domain-containing protein [Microbacter margulisiae]MBB3186285.1 hypothetical protein [Microbacter margulisiae]
MKTKIEQRMMCWGLCAVNALLLMSCNQQDALKTSKPSYGNLIQVASDGSTTVLTNNLQAAFVATPSLSDSELALLLKIKEDEKLARDVYSNLSTAWSQPIFANIETAEERHLQAILTLLRFYNQPDTLVADMGVFSTPELTQLYQTFVSNGKASLVGAYQVGIQIEEMDIKDLMDGLASNPNTNIVTTFDNLLKASRNHLRAFYRQLSNLGIVYVPQYLSQEEYDSIVQSPMEQGNTYVLQNQYQYNYQYQYRHQGH